MKLSVFSCYPKLANDAQFVVEKMSDTMARAKRCGVTGIEYTSCPVNELDVADIQKGTAETGVRLSIIGSYYWVTGLGLSMLSENPTVAQTAVDTFKKALSIGAQIDTPVALGQIRGNVPDSYKPVSYYEDKLVEILKDVAAYADKVGATFTIEPENRFFLNWINTSRQGLHIINRVGSDRFKLTLDLKHMNVEEDITEALIVGRDVLHNVHFIDADNSYAHPGGLLDFDSIIRTLSALRFDGWICIATSGPENPALQDSTLADGARYINALIEQYRV